MIANSDNFRVMILSYDEKEKKYTLNINNSHITSGESDILLGVEIKNKLNFEKHI